MGSVSGLFSSLISTSPLALAIAIYSSRISHSLMSTFKKAPPNAFPLGTRRPLRVDVDIINMPSYDIMLEKGLLEQPDPEQPAAHILALHWLFNLLRPSFSKRSGAMTGNNKVVRTVYLDGLRGFAAFLVYFHHHHLWARGSIPVAPILENAFGYNRQFYFVSLPFVRNFFSGGHFAVAIFFVVSGYVLSAKPLSLIHAGDFVKLGDNVASALFRRWLRLNIPLICTTFAYFTILHAFHIRTSATPMEKSYRDEIWKWYCEFKNFSFVFRTGGEPWFSYNFHAWSIPVEFKGSIVIYTTVLALSRATRNARLWCEVGLIFYFMYIADGWFCAMFVAGMLLSDLDLLATADNLPTFFSNLKPYKKIIFYTLFVVSLYLGGIPSHSFDVFVLRKSPGWYYLSFLKPQAFFDYKWFYLFWAATFMVSCIPHISWLKSFFETRFNQYLGRISYALYLVHGPVLWTLGDRLYAATGWLLDDHAMTIPRWINRFPLPKAGPLGLELNFWTAQLILLPFTLWLAELVTRAFDEPSVNFVNWAYKKAQE
jgi:peptidoglycan/LPS O-acetylase OafA/YrhL